MGYPVAGVGAGYPVGYPVAGVGAGYPVCHPVGYGMSPAAFALVLFVLLVIILRAGWV